MKTFVEKVNLFYRKAYDKFPHIEPILVISLSMLLVLGIILSIKGISTDDNTTFTNNVAEDLFYKAEYDKAVEEYKNLQKEEDWPIWNVKIAEIYSIKGEYERSNTLLKESIVKRDRIIKEKGIEKYKEKDVELINEVVFTFLMNNEKEEALGLGESHLHDYLNNKQMIKTMVAVYIANNKVDKAEKLINDYLINNTTAFDYALASEMYMSMGKVTKGIDILKKAWDLDKNELEIYNAMSQIQEIDKKNLLDKLNLLSKENLNEDFYKVFMAEIYSTDKDSIIKAEKILDDLNDKENINVRLLEIEIYNKANRDKEAEEIIKEIVNQDKDSYLAKNLLAWDALWKKDYDSALDFAKKCIVKNSNCARAYGVLVPQILVEKGDTKIAEPFFRTAIKKEPFNYNMINKLGEYYGRKAIDIEKAKKVYNLVMNIGRDDSEAFYNLSKLYMIDKKPKEAIKNAKGAIKNNEDVSKYYRLLGALYLEQGLYEDGIEETRTAYLINENDILALNNAACYYFAITGEIERGMENMKEAYDSLSKISDLDVKKALTENYNKAKSIYDNYQNGKESYIRIADFTLFY